jgi:flagellar hook-associated protein 3 FlgL
MRITPRMMANVFVGNLRRQSQAMFERQEQISSARRINRASDDPAGAGRVLRGRSVLASIDQYAVNIKRAKSRIEFTEQMLELADDLVMRAYRTAAEKAGDEVTAEERALAAEGMKELYDQLLQAANSRFYGRYIFGGHQTDQAPFTRDDAFAVTYHGNDGAYRVPIAENVQVTLDADGENYFQNGAAGGVDIFDALGALIAGLEANDSAAIRGAIDPLEDARAQLMNKRTELAPKLYRLEATEEHWKNYRVVIAEAIGRDQDLDLAQAAIELKSLETSYEATLATASRILQQSLVDFLK